MISIKSNDSEIFKFLWYTKVLSSNDEQEDLTEELAMILRKKAQELFTNGMPVEKPALPVQLSFCKRRSNQNRHIKLFLNFCALRSANLVRTAYIHEKNIHNQHERFDKSRRISSTENSKKIGKNRPARSLQLVIDYTKYN